MTRFFLFILLPLLSSCTGQGNIRTPKDNLPLKPVPEVIGLSRAHDLYLDADSMLVSQYIRSIFQDAQGHLWFGTLGEGVVRYDSTTLTYFDQSDGMDAGSVQAINEDRNGHIWLGTEKGIFKYNGISFQHYHQPHGLSHVDITRKGIIVDKAGTIWIGTPGGVFQYIPSADTTGGQCFRPVKVIPDQPVTAMLEDRNGHLWIAIQNDGVYRLNPTAGTEAMAISHITGKEGLGGNYAGGMAVDKAGNIWMTMKDGICRYDPTASKQSDTDPFTEYTFEDGIGGTEIWGLWIESSGIIWITARGATTRFDPSMTLPDSNAFTVYTPEDGLNCCVQSMYEDRSGRMWWGAGSGLYRFDGKGFFQVKQNGPW